MAQMTDTKDLLLQNLQDAGCDKILIDRCMALYESRGELAVIPILASYRIELLERIHYDQNKLDCLDYLIYRFNKEAEKTR